MARHGINAVLPYFASGKVVSGFGRGSKQLGCPTANFPSEVVDNLPLSFDCGVYFGWASVDNGKVYEMVMSVGYNPHFKNTKKTMETHLLHEFADDFYGSILKVIVTGHIRPMTTFSSLDSLMEAINNDKSEGKKRLQFPENLKFKDHAFFLPQGEINHVINGGKFVEQVLSENESSKKSAM